MLHRKGRLTRLISSASTPSSIDPIHLLDIRVGLVVSCTKHPLADSLLVEQVDLGEKLTQEKVVDAIDSTSNSASESQPHPPSSQNSLLRTIVSGLAKYYSPEDIKVKSAEV